MTAADVAPIVSGMALAVSCWSLYEARRSYRAACRALRATEDAANRWNGPRS